MSQDISPEEKLLKHIRKKTPAGVFKKKTEEHLPEGKSVDVNWLPLSKRILVIVALGLSGLVIWQLFQKQESVSALVQDFSKSTPAALEEELPSVTAKPYSFYGEQIRGRDLFESSSARAQRQVKQAVAAPLPDLMKNLKLVGIVVADKKEAIIEDLDAKQTFFLREGDRLRGAVIESIAESKVVAVIGAERFELVP